MADQIYPDQGLVESLLNVADNGGQGLTWTIFSNDITPDLDSVLADFDLVAAAWAKEVWLAIDYPNHYVNLHVGTIQSEVVSFVNPGPGPIDIYGYVAVDQVGNLLILACRFDDAPRTIAEGGALNLVAQIGDSSQVLTDIIDGGTF